MTLGIYQPPEDEEEPELRIYSREAEEEEEKEEKDSVILQYTSWQRGAHRRNLYVSPWDPADTL